MNVTNDKKTTLVSSQIAQMLVPYVTIRNFIIT